MVLLSLNATLIFYKNGRIVGKRSKLLTPQGSKSDLARITVPDFWHDFISLRHLKRANEEFL